MVSIALVPTQVFCHIQINMSSLSPHVITSHTSSALACVPFWDAIYKKLGKLKIGLERMEARLMAWNESLRKMRDFTCGTLGRSHRAALWF